MEKVVHLRLIYQFGIFHNFLRTGRCCFPFLILGVQINFGYSFQNSKMGMAWLLGAEGPREVTRVGVNGSRIYFFSRIDLCPEIKTQGNIYVRR
jgi:hypothetical protein